MVRAMYIQRAPAERMTVDAALKRYLQEVTPTKRESKVYKDATSAITECAASLAPSLVEPEYADAERERDLILLSDKADLSDLI